MLPRIAPLESVTYLGHATVRLDLAGARLLTDPALRDRLGHLRRRSRPLAPEDYEPLDGVLVSHLHLDHLDMPSMRRLERTVPVVVPRGGGAILRRIGFTDVREVVAGESVRIAGVEVLAVPAAHDPRRRPGGVEADPLGYVAGGAARIYFAGDTDVFDGMGELGALDLALLPVWGWGPTLGTGHMDPEAAARALVRLRPRAAVPNGREHPPSRWRHTSLLCSERSRPISNPSRSRTSSTARSSVSPWWSRSRRIRRDRRSWPAR